MARNTAARHHTLRETLTDLAHETIVKDGLSALRARDLAGQAGCAVGTIYTLFDDLHGLTLAVNARTFAKLGQAVAETTDDRAEPLVRLITMAQAYGRFASRNPNTWAALFNYERPKETEAPEWYLAEMGQLFLLIDGPLRELDPEMSEDQRALLTRTLFSAVHGIVLLSVQEASAGVAKTHLDAAIEDLLRRIAA